MLPRASFVASLRIAGHRIAAYLFWHRWASLVSSQLCMAKHRRSSPGIAGRSWTSFFLQDYIVFHSRFIISPGIAGHRGHRCVSLLASLGIFRSLGIAAHRWAWHRCVSLLALLGIFRFFTASYGWASQVIARKCRPSLHIFFLFSVISFFILALLSLLASPGIAGIAAYFSWHRWASFVVSLGIDWVSLDIARYRRAWPGIAGHLRIVQGLAIYNCLY